MKNALIHVLFLLFEICVFVDAETVSVIEGDSVTLHTGVTEIQRDDDIEWRLNGKRIARIKAGSITTEGASKDRLKLDEQTGDLKITNIKTTDSGEYKLKISSPRGSSEKIFSVSVSAAPVKTVSVLVGDSVTLHTNLTQTEEYDVIQWRFEHLNSSIAEINRTARIFSTYDVPDERFKDKLLLDCLTGSLTIKNIETKHSAVYDVDITISNGYTKHKSFTVTVSGEVKSVLSVMEGEPVTLNSSLTEIQTDDLMQWMFGDSQIAEIYKEDNRFSTSDNRLKLDNQTGSLTITNTRNTDSGLYELKISSSRRTIHRRIAVSVTGSLSAGAILGICFGVVFCFLLAFAAGVAVVICNFRLKNPEVKEWGFKEWILSVLVGEPLTLTPDTEVHKDDALRWMFGGSCIAERKEGADRFTVYDDVPDKTFKGRLKLDHQTGSLTIMNITDSDSGYYELRITRPRKRSTKRFIVSVFYQTDDLKTVSVKKGEPVKLEGVADIQTIEEILWMFGHFPIAEIKRGNKQITSFANEVFEGRLDLDHQTGSLTIKNTKPTDAGLYVQYSTTEGNVKLNLFRVKLYPTDNRNNPVEERVRRNNPEEMPLNSLA